MRVRVVTHLSALPAIVPALLAIAAFALPARAAASPIDKRGMWIWYLDRSDRGNLGAIIARSRAAGVQTLFVKAADGGHYWSQFSPALVRRLHAGGLNACAWQYVYGNAPATEARLGARAVANGADCLVIDAEAEYEGKYASAQVYMRTLRAAIGPRYPVGLASFPYVDFHPGFPFSVFLAPGGAQYDMPQMYWRDIGARIDTVFGHTYRGNRIYGRAIYPVGQTYGVTSGAETRWFRGLTVRYGAHGISWWDYAWTSADSLWAGIAGAFTVISAAPSPGYPLLHEGSTGDEVVLLQERLARAVPWQAIDGSFGAMTLAHLRRFQARHRLAVTGVTDMPTWRALLHLHPVVPVWSGHGQGDSGGSGLTGGGSGAGAVGGVAAGSGGAPIGGPRSAREPARRYEIRSEHRRAELAASVR